MSCKSAHPVFFIAAVLVGLMSGQSFSSDIHPIYSENMRVDTVPFYTGGAYDPAIPHPDDYFDYSIGYRSMRYHELEGYLAALAEASDRVELKQHGVSYEGRQMYNVIISDPAHIERLEEIREDIARLADPSSDISESAANEKISSLPAVAWLGYSIHGDELSGTDAGLLLAYHLAAARDEATFHLLRNLVIIIDPSENPDGRERYLAMLQSNQSAVSNYDAQSSQHGGVWPWGRGNHYMFDLNRDWILLRQAETIGRVRTIVDWHPQVVVDAHEMGPHSTFLFSPPRQPINYNTPDNVMKWYAVYNADQAAAFDRRGWPYYSGEWNEQWYPGYGSAWPTFQGTVGILYEQAGVAGTPLKQRDDYLLTYHEAVNHQFTSSLANLKTTADNREQLLRDYYETRKSIVEQGQKSGLQFIFVPDDDRIKMKRFIESLIEQGIIVERAVDRFSVGSCTDIYRERHSSRAFPPGTYIVNTAQPQGALAKAILEFDLHLNYEFLKEERREIEKFGDTRLYEVSSWSLPLAYDIEAYYTTGSFSARTERVETVDCGSRRVRNPEAQFGFILDMEGETTYLALKELFARDLTVYCATEPFTIAGVTFKPGALLVRKRGNPDNLPALLDEIAHGIGIEIHGVNSGRSSEGSYLGAPTFELLARPHIALLTGSPLNFTSVGTLWYTLDQELGIPHSLIRISELGRTDLASYNVLIIPSIWGSGLSRVIAEPVRQKIERWIADGGTLICTGQAAVWAADTATGLSEVRLRRQVLDRLDEFQRALERELRAENPPVDTMALWHPEKASNRETDSDEKRPTADIRELAVRDEWQRKFHPRGAMFRANLDREDWLAFGMEDRVPVQVYTRHAFMAMPPVKTSARFAAENDLRLSGLLWPEARERWAGTAYATRERKERGQIVLFATDPNKRAYFYGTRAMFVNAVLYGPGMVGDAEDYQR